MTEVVLRNDLVKNLELMKLGLDENQKEGVDLAIAFIQTGCCPRMIVYKYCPECGEKLYTFDDIVLLKMPHEYQNGCGECRGCEHDGGGYCELWSQIEDLIGETVKCSQRGNEWKEKE